MNDLSYTRLESERVADLAALVDAMPYAIVAPEKWPAELQPIEYLMLFGTGRCCDLVCSCWHVVKAEVSIGPLRESACSSAHVR